jgi:hypothetical protein
LGAEALAQAAITSFGLVFHHLIGDGDGRLHCHCSMISWRRAGLMPNDRALPGPQAG